MSTELSRHANALSLDEVESLMDRQVHESETKLRRSMHSLAPSHSTSAVSVGLEHARGFVDSDLDLTAWQCRPCSDQDAMDAKEIEKSLKSLDMMNRLNLELELSNTLNIRIRSDRKLELLNNRACKSCLLATQQGSPCPAENEVKLQLMSVLLKRCFACGSPFCPKHQSKTSYPKHGIALCTTCEHLFTIDFVKDLLVAPASQRMLLLGDLLSVYDRTWLRYQTLILHKSALVRSLEEAAVHRNHINVGKSSAGMISGALGVAAAATAAIPVFGTSLLVASLFFGGGAVAVQTSTSIHQHFMFLPQKQAMQLLASHTILQSIHNVVQTLRDSIARDQAVHQSSLDSNHLLISGKVDDHDASVSSNGDIIADTCNVGRCSLAGVELMVTSSKTVAVGASSGGETMSGTLLSDVVQSTSKLTRLVGGALAAATMVMEAHSLASHVYESCHGSSCTIAKRISQMNANDFSSPIRLDEECQSYLSNLSRRDRLMTEAEVQSILLSLFAESPTLYDPSSDDVESCIEKPMPYIGKCESPSASLNSMPKKERMSSLDHLRNRIESYSNDGKKQMPLICSLPPPVEDSDASSSESSSCDVDYEDDNNNHDSSKSSFRLSLRDRIARHQMLHRST